MEAGGYSADSDAKPLVIRRSFGSDQRNILRLLPAALLLMVFLTAALVSSTPAGAQCAMCQGSSGAGADGGASYNRSTLFMLCVPYLLLGAVAGYVVYAFRRNRSGIESSKPPVHSSEPSPTAEGEPV